MLKYSAQIRKTREALAPGTTTPVQKEKLDQLISALVGACENARRYAKCGVDEFCDNRIDALPPGIVKPLCGALKRVTKYFHEYPRLANEQVAMALIATGFSIQSPLPRLDQSLADDLSKILGTLETLVKNQSGRINANATEWRRVGNLAYPLPSDADENPEAKPLIPKKTPKVTTMLAFELTLRFRAWSLGQLVDFETDDDAMPMPRGGKPRYGLVRLWTENALGPNSLDIEKRVSELVGRSKAQLASWPVPEAPITIRIRRKPE